jgi:hypothetical protein
VRADQVRYLWREAVSATSQKRRIELRPPCRVQGLEAVKSGGIARARITFGRRPPQPPRQRAGHRAANDRYRPDVHLLRHPGDADGDRLRLRLRPVVDTGRLLVRAGPDGARRAGAHAALLPAPPGRGAPGSRPPALGGRSRLRPVQPPVPGGGARAGRGRGVHRHGRLRHGAPAHPWATALGDARDRGSLGRTGRPDRQGPPRRDRRRGRRPTLGTAARPLPGGRCRRRPASSPTRCRAW